MHLIFDIFSKHLKSLTHELTEEEEFNVFVQQQFVIYEMWILDPTSLSSELHSSLVQSHHHPRWEKYKRLRSISFVDFQQFCRSFCEEVKFTALVHGNIGEDYAVNIMENISNDFRCERIENVSIRH